MLRLYKKIKSTSDFCKCSHIVPTYGDATYNFLADVVHDSHDGILVPPVRVLDGLDFTTHNDNLTSRNQFPAAVSRAKVLRNTGGSDIAIQRLGQPRNKLVALAGRESGGRVRSEDKVAVEVDDQSITGRSEERPALGRDTEYVRARLLNEILGMACVHDRDVEATPFVDANAEPDGFSSHGQHGGVVTDKDDAAGRRDGRLDDADDVGNRQAAEQWPHSEVLEAGGRRRELIAEGVVLHVDAHQIIQARSGEAQNPRDLLGVEEVGRLVPMNPHAPEVVTEKVVERVAREERQAVRDPVLLLRVIVEVGLRPPPQLTDRLGPLLIGARPDTQADTIERVRRILLEDEGVVDTMRLGAAGANLDVMREAGLGARAG